MIAMGALLQRWLRATLLLLALGPTTARAAEEISLTAQRLSEHCWFFQGEADMATASNKGFMSNAGFVVTPDGVIAFDALGTPALDKMITVNPVVAVPAFEQANRTNAYGTYLLMEQEALNAGSRE